VLVEVGVLGDGEQAIVADPLAPGRPLLRLNGADHPTCHDATDRHRHVEQHEHVECIAVLGDRRWNEAEIIGKRQAGRQHPPEVESSSVRIVAVLVAAPLGGLDDHREVADFGIPCRQLREWPHGASGARL
jgi:hypothetical protein